MKFRLICPHVCTAVHLFNYINSFSQRTHHLHGNPELVLAVVQSFSLNLFKADISLKRTPMLILIVLHSYSLTLCSRRKFPSNRHLHLFPVLNCLSKKELTVFFFLALQIRPESLSTLLEIVPYIDTLKPDKARQARDLRQCPFNVAVG